LIKIIFILIQIISIDELSEREKCPNREKKCDREKECYHAIFCETTLQAVGRERRSSLNQAVLL